MAPWTCRPTGPAAEGAPGRRLYEYRVVSRPGPGSREPLPGCPPVRKWEGRRRCEAHPEDLYPRASETVRGVEPERGASLGRFEWKQDAVRRWLAPALSVGSSDAEGPFFVPTGGESMATGSVVSRLSGRGATFGRPRPVVRGANGTGGSMRASSSRHRRICLLAALTVGLSVLSAASLARAAGVAAVAFPGKNGLIAFNSDGSVYVVSPNGATAPSHADRDPGRISGCLVLAEREVDCVLRNEHDRPRHLHGTPGWSGR